MLPETLRLLVVEPPGPSPLRLTGPGLEIRLAPDLGAARAALAESEADAVVLDLRMDGPPGIAALSAAAPAVPIVSVGDRIADAEHDAVEAGADACWDRSGDTAALVRKLRALVRRRRRQSAASGTPHHEQLWTQFAQAVQQVFWLQDGDGRILYVSPAYEKVVGRRVEALRQEPADFFEAVHPDDRAAVEAAAAAALRREVDLQFRILGDAGSLRWVRGRWFPAQGRDGRLSRIAASIEDITASRQLEESYRESQKLEAVGRLAGGVAHDFNNILTAVIGYADLLALTLPQDSEAAGDVKNIRSAANRAAALTRQLLAFGRRQVLEPMVLDPGACVSDLVEDMLSRIIGEDIQLHVVRAPDTGSIRVDRAQLDQVVLNLAINARDAMPNGGRLVIETSNVDIDDDYAAAHPGVRPGRYVQIAVTDTGVGMAEEVRLRVFEPFFSTKGHKGNGLGLATVYGVVQQSGGHIFVYSEPGQGSTFKVLLPRVAEQPSRPLAAPAPRVAAGGRETVLVVEDDPALRLLAARTLGAGGYRTIIASCAEEALEACRRAERIDVLVTDVVMPEVSGPSLAKRVSELKPEVRVLYMSGYSEEAVSTHGLLTRGSRFISKPFAPADLLEGVRAAAHDVPRGG